MHNGDGNAAKYVSDYIFSKIIVGQPFQYGDGLEEARLETERIQFIFNDVLY